MSYAGKVMFSVPIKYITCIRSDSVSVDWMTVTPDICCSCFPEFEGTNGLMDEYHAFYCMVKSRPPREALPSLPRSKLETAPVTMDCYGACLPKPCRCSAERIILCSLMLEPSLRTDQTLGRPDGTDTTDTTCLCCLPGVLRAAGGCNHGTSALMCHASG